MYINASLLIKIKHELSLRKSYIHILGHISYFGVHFTLGMLALCKII